MASRAEAVVGGVGAALLRPRRRLLDSLEPYVFLSPGLVLIGLVMFVPVIVGLSYAFRDVQLFDASGEPVAEAYTGDPGGECVVDAHDLVGGDYVVDVHTFAGVPVRAGVGAPPAFVTGQYTLEVDQ